MKAAAIRIGFRQCALPGHRFDTAHTSGNTGLRHNAHQADISGALNVGTAAKFNREIPTHAQHTNAVAVFLAKQHHGTALAGGVDIRFQRLNGRIAANFRINHIFNGREFFRLHRFAMSKVKTQTLGSNQRAFLTDVIAQYLTQRRMQQVRGGVIQCRRLTDRCVHQRLYG